MSDLSERAGYQKYGNFLRKKSGRISGTAGTGDLKTQLPVQAGGEIDLIARDKEYLVFVEVKCRSQNRAGYSLDAVNPAKQKQISKAARYLLAAEHHCTEIPCRFDVIGIDGGCLHWIKDAFGFCI